MYFADSLDRAMCSFFKQQHKQLMLEPLQSHPSVCGFCTIYAAFHQFNFRQDEIWWIHDVRVFSFTSDYKEYIFFFVILQVIQYLCCQFYSLIKFFNFWDFFNVVYLFNFIESIQQFHSIAQFFQLASSRCSIGIKYLSA